MILPDITFYGQIITGNGQIIALISLGIALASSLVRRAVLDLDKMKEMKVKMKEHQKALKEATKSGDKKKAKRAQDELMKLTMENMKHSFKPMLYTFIPFILIFMWLKSQYGGVGAVATLFNFELTWFWWYLITSMIFSMILNKALKLS